MGSQLPPRRRRYFVDFRAISILFTSLSIFGFVHAGLNFGLSRAFELLLSVYNESLSFVLKLTQIEPALRFILSRLSKIFDIDLDLHEHWRHSFVVMALYFAIDLRSYVDRKLPLPATISSAIFGVLIAIAFSVASGIYSLADPIRLAIVLPIAGFVLYELAKAPVTATFVPIVGLSWLQTYLYYTINYGVFNAALGFASVKVFEAPQLVKLDGSGALIFVAFLILLCLRNVLVSAFKATWKRNTEISWWSQFFGSGSVRAAVNIVYALGLCALYLMSNAALKAVGQ